MRFGVSLPNLGDYADPHFLTELGRETEDAGWDGVFVWDCVEIGGGDGRPLPTADPWIALAAIAGSTSRVRLGPFVLPLARRRPWKVARETVTLDHLSGGRLILPVGYGVTEDGAFGKVGEDVDARTRAAKVEEGLEILTGLWSGERFSYHGDHYQMEEMTFLPRPVQSPRIPIWLDAVWPRMRSMRRGARFDGILPGVKDEDGGPVTPEHIRAIRAWLEDQRGDLKSFDIVHEGETPGDDPDAAWTEIRPWAEAGVTWWIEAVWTHFYRGTPESMLERIRQGPPVRVGTSTSVES